MDDPCEPVLRALGPHWMTEAMLRRLSSVEGDQLRRCLEQAVADGRAETPRGTYRGTMWRRLGAGA